MQFSRGSIKALGAISGCFNKAIVAHNAPAVAILSLPPFERPPSRPHRSVTFSSLLFVAILLANLICLFPGPRAPETPVRQRGGPFRTRLEGYRPGLHRVSLRALCARGGGSSPGRFARGAPRRPKQPPGRATDYGRPALPLQAVIFPVYPIVSTRACTARAQCYTT